MRDNNKDKFKLLYTVDVKPENTWEGNVGFVTKDMISKNLPEPSPDTIIMYCGPPPFEDMMKLHLKELGYTEDMVYKF